MSDIPLAGVQLGLCGCAPWPYSPWVISTSTSLTAYALLLTMVYV